MYIPILVLLYSTICKHIRLVHQYRGRNERKTEICEEPITERNDDKDEYIQFTKMVKDKTKSDFALTKKKCLDLLLELSGIVQNTDERHFEAVKHVLKSTVSVKNTLATMKKNVAIVKLRPCHENCSREKFRAAKKIFLNSQKYADVQTKYANEKYANNVKYAKPTDEEKALFMLQNMFAEETVEKDVPVRDTKEGAIKLTKGMTKLCFK